MALRSVPQSSSPRARAVAYIRVSQARDGMVSPELQLRAVRDYCQRRGYELVETLEDLDRSGRFWKRRQVEQAITMIERDRADVLVVWRWSRVTRNRLDWAVAVDRVETAGGRLESALEGFDATTSSGKLARGILAEIAAFESDRIGDVWREVHERRVAHGLLPQGQPMFGYRKVNGRYVRDRRTGRILAEMYRRYVAGESLNSLVRWINRQGLNTAPPKRTDCEWSFSTLRRVMDSGFAAGYIRDRGELIPGIHKPIISEDVWKAYLTRRAATSRRYSPAPDDVLLTKLVWCGCGSRMLVIRQSKPRYPVYRCASHPAGRAGVYMSHRRADALVALWLAALVANPTVRAACTADFHAHVARQSDKAAEVRGQLPGAAPTEQVALLAMLRELRDVMPEPARLAGALLEDWNVLNVTQRRAQLLALTNRVVVHNELAHPYLVMHTTWGTVMSFSDEDGPPGEAAVTEGVSGTAATGTGLVLLTPAEAARLAGVQVQTLRHWDVHGRLPHTKAALGGHSRLYDLADLRALRPPSQASGAQPRPTSRRTAPTAAIRAWGQTNGFPISAQGRIPLFIVNAYRQAHPVTRWPPQVTQR